MSAASTIRDPQLGLFEEKPGSANVVWLETVLKTQRRWLTAAELLELAGRKNNDDGKRLIRGLANASEWILSGPGSPGYRHMECSTPEEIDHYSNANISQGKDMIRRGIKIKRNAHKIFG